MTTQTEVPVITDSLAALQWFRDRGTPVSRDELSTASARVGRNSGPWLECMLHYSGLLSDDAYTLTPEIWGDAEYPNNLLTQADWRELFARARYCVDGQRADRPAGPITLYRGAPAKYKRRWAWTASLDVATQFTGAKMQPGVGFWTRLPGVVWTASVEPWRLFCHGTGRGEDGHAEDEYVIDTKGLTITQRKAD